MRIFWILAEHVEPSAIDLNSIQAAHDIARPLCTLSPAELNVSDIATKVLKFLKEEDPALAGS